MSVAAVVIPIATDALPCFVAVFVIVVVDVEFVLPVPILPVRAHLLLLLVLVVVVLSKRLLLLVLVSSLSWSSSSIRFLQSLFLVRRFFDFVLPLSAVFVLGGVNVPAVAQVRSSVAQKATATA